MITYNIILLYFFSKWKEFIKNKKSIYWLFIYYILVKFFNELKKVGAEFGYRTAVEMLLLIKKLNIISSISKNESIDIAVMQKLLPLLYMKTAMLEKPIPVGDDDIQVFVTESDYEAIKQSVSRLVAANDAYYDGESAASISENLTDIYQIDIYPFYITNVI